jgi:hypothetical protein
MRRFSTVVGLAAGALLAGTVSASAAIFATGITYNADNVTAGRGTTDDRANGNNALGATNGTFFEIGLNGDVDFTFGTVFTGPGAVVEVTFGSRPGFPEFANFFVGDGVTFSPIDNNPISNSSGGSILLSFSGGPFSVLRVQDAGSTVSQCDDGAGGTYACGGFDIDSVMVSEIPLPASLLMLLAGLGGLGFFGRSRKAA